VEEEFYTRWELKRFYCDDNASGITYKCMGIGEEDLPISHLLISDTSECLVFVKGEHLDQVLNFIKLIEEGGM